MSLTSLEVTTKKLAKINNNAHFMLVDGMHKLMTRKVKSCQSDFYAFGVKWRLRVRSRKKSNYLSCYLFITDSKCTGSDWEVRCSFELGVVSQTTGPNDCKSYEACLNDKQVLWGTERFISNTKLEERFIVNDKAVFYAQITKVIPSFTVPSISKTVGTVKRIKLMEVPRDNSRFTWKITQFSSFDGIHHSSHEFTVGPRRWKLKMYPEGRSSTGVGHLSLFLAATNYVTNDPKGTTLAVFKLRVLDQLHRKHFEIQKADWFPNDPDDQRISLGCHKIMPLAKLHDASNGFLVDGEIYLGVEFLFVSTSEIL